MKHTIHLPLLKKVTLQLHQTPDEIYAVLLKYDWGEIYQQTLKEFADSTKTAPDTGQIQFCGLYNENVTPTALAGLSLGYSGNCVTPVQYYVRILTFDYPPQLQKKLEAVIPELANTYMEQLMQSMHGPMHFTFTSSFGGGKSFRQGQGLN